MEHIDKYGKCPCCKFNLDGGDIREQISRIDVFHHKPEEIITAMAESYGWKADKPTRFTKLISKDSPLGLFWRCPYCGYTIDQKTGKQVDPRTLLPLPEKPKEEGSLKEQRDALKGIMPLPTTKDLMQQLKELEDDMPF